MEVQHVQVSEEVALAITTKNEEVCAVQRRRVAVPRSRGSTAAGALIPSQRAGVQGVQVAKMCPALPATPKVHHTHSNQRSAVPVPRLRRSSLAPWRDPGVLVHIQDGGVIEILPPLRLSSVCVTTENDDVRTDGGLPFSERAHQRRGVPAARCRRDALHLRPGPLPIALFHAGGVEGVPNGRLVDQPAQNCRVIAAVGNSGLTVQGPGDRHHIQAHCSGGAGTT
mmetsp:Transcript_32211/g.77162  ORF Transcript_32211/g.77162 Transcript_32211/m.77162 type:complete len:225 (-) Transcript_32211:7-681(-)